MVMVILTLLVLIITISVVRNNLSHRAAVARRAARGQEFRQHRAEVIERVAAGEAGIDREQVAQLRKEVGVVAASRQTYRTYHGRN